MIRKKKQPIFLLNKQVEFTDTTARSENVLNVQVPSILTVGKNPLVILPNPQVFTPNTPIQLEIVDREGYPIYHELVEDLDGDVRISIWIYPDTPSGTCRIILVGSVNGSTTTNYKWVGTCEIHSQVSNSSDIIFSKDFLPILAVSESIVSYPTRAYTRATQTSSQIYTWLPDRGPTYFYRGKTAYISNTNPPIGFGTSNIFVADYLSASVVFHYTASKATPTLRNAISIPFATTASGILLVSGSIATSDIKTTTRATISQGFGTSKYNEGIHTFSQIAGISKLHIQYRTPSTPVYTAQKRSIANFNLTNLNPAIGEINKFKVFYRNRNLHEILPNGTWLFLTEIDSKVTSSQAQFQIPIFEPQRSSELDFRVAYVNSIGNVSKYESYKELVFFTGSGAYFQGNDNIFSGSFNLGGTLNLSGLSASNAYFVNAFANKLTASNAKFTNAIINKLTASSATFTNAFAAKFTASNAKFTQIQTVGITASSASFTNASSTKLTSSNALFTQVRTTGLTASSAFITKLTASLAFFNNARASKFTASNAQFVQIQTTGLTASSAFLTKLTSSNAFFTKLRATQLTASGANFTNAFATRFTASNAQFTLIRATTVTASNVRLLTASIGRLSATILSSSRSRFPTASVGQLFDLGTGVDTYVRTVRRTTKAVYSSTTVVDDSVLRFQVVSGSVYTFKSLLIYSSSVSTNGLRVGITYPTSQIVNAVVRIPQTSTTEFVGWLPALGGTVTATATPLGVTRYPAEIEGMLIPTANGTFAISVGCEVASTTVTIHQGSFIRWNKI